MVNLKRDGNPTNDVSIQRFLADSNNLDSLKLTDATKLTEAKGYLIAALGNISDAITEMDGESDDQYDDLVTLDELTIFDIAEAQDFISDASNSISMTRILRTI